MTKSLLSKNVYFAVARPYLALLLILVPLLLFRSSQQSLIAHDEAFYAQQARWIVESGDWMTPRWWAGAIYDRPIGLQWMIAIAYTLFGVSEDTARLPSFIACILSVFLTYNIGRQLLNSRIAWLGAAILSVTPIWVQYGRLTMQDTLLVCVELLGIWALLQAETQSSRRFYWGILAGSTLGLGFLVKGFMIILPVVALLPYLIWEHRRHRHLTNPGLYLGLGLGAIPLMGWLGVSSLRYGLQPYQELIGKLFLLGSTSWKGTTPWFYLWNIPANAFPWPLFALLGYGLVLGKTVYGRQIRNQGHLLLLLGYPLILFLELSVFKTRTQYYPLQLLPFVALLAGIALDWLLQLYTHREAPHRRLLAVLSYLFGGLAALLLVAGIAIIVGIPGVAITEEVRSYAAIALGLGAGWILLPLVWLKRDRQRSAQYWLASWILGPWLALGTLGITGLWGNYNPDLKSFVQQPLIASVLQNQPIDFVATNLPNDDAEKALVLLTFYTPHLGQMVNQISDVSAPYAWVGPQHPIEPQPERYQVVAQVRDWHLIRTGVDAQP